MNKVILAGRLTRDPEVRYTQSGKAVASFTLAVDRRFGRRNAEANGQPTADFIPIVVWERLAEVCGNNLIKGSQVLVEGRMQVRSYDAQDGSKRFTGTLAGYDNGAVSILLPDKSTRRFEKNQIAQVRLAVSIGG